MTTMRPTMQLIETKSNKCFFSYPYNITQFQTGYLGIGPSTISGGFHLRYPSSTPIYVSRIYATLVGQEAITFFSYDDLQNKKHTFYSSTQCIYPPPSSLTTSLDKFTPITSLDLNFEFSLDDDIPPSYSPPFQSSSPLSQDVIKYKIKITIIRKRNYFKLQGNNKIISTICQIDRYSLPSKFKLSNTPILIHRSDTQNSNSKLDLIRYEASLVSEYIDMNSIIAIPLTLILPDSSMKFQEIHVVIKEHQTFEDIEKEIVYFDGSNKILEYKLLGESAEIFEEEINKYYIEMKLDVPAFESVNRFQAFEGVRVMKYFNVEHVLKIKIKFNDGSKLVLKKNVWLQRSLSEKKIQKGRERGCIYKPS